jgi:ABC-type multidrug transport system fused ATPase/permease subunit
MPKAIPMIIIGAIFSIVYFLFLPLIFAVLLTFVTATGVMVSIMMIAQKAYRLEIERDIRNPSRKPFSRIAEFDKKDGVYRVYKSVFSMWPESVRPYFDPVAFANPKRHIRGYIGVTGKAGDDNFVPLGMTLMSGATANQFAINLSDAIQNEIINMNPLNKDETAIKEIKERFTGEWVMKHFGITDVRDVNVVLQHQKIQVADLHSRHSEFIARHESWFAKNSALVLTAVMFVIVAIGAVILWDGVATNAAQGNQALALISHYVHATNITNVTPPSGIKVT